MRKRVSDTERSRNPAPVFPACVLLVLCAVASAHARTVPAPGTPVPLDGRQSLECTTVRASDATAPVHLLLDTEGASASDLVVEIREDPRVTSSDFDQALRFTVPGMDGGLNCSGDHVVVELTGSPWPEAGTVVLTVSPDTEVAVTWKDHGRDRLTTEADRIGHCRFEAEAGADCALLALDDPSAREGGGGM
mgnify:CR=1 FL=1